MREHHNYERLDVMHDGWGDVISSASSRGHAPDVEYPEALLATLKDWYEDRRNGAGTVIRGDMAIGLAVLELMRSNLPLGREDYLTVKQGQVKNAGGPAIHRILQRFGEHRFFSHEGGRTNRGGLDAASALVDAISRSANFDRLVAASHKQRNDVIDELQQWLVGRIQKEYFDRQSITVSIDVRKPAREAVNAVVVAARRRQGTAAGAVIQHLVGAYMTVAFPELEIGQDSYTTADFQTGRRGDFEVGDAAIHVTMAPSDNLMKLRCQANLNEGFRPIVLVPSDRLVAARQLAENAGLSSQVSSYSVEDFIGSGLEAMGLFEHEGVRAALYGVLFAYNSRIDLIEGDPSLRIRYPASVGPAYEPA